MSITSLVQRKVGDAEIGSDVEFGINAIRGSGQLLPESVRNFFEPRFGYDFGNVRVHTDAKASGLAHGVNAKAFTIGRDVVFGACQYKPDSVDGRSLLAYELVHTIQQARAGGARTHLQRTIGDGHDLTSPRFAGDERLEACYDDEARLTKGDQGDSVRKVQQALIELGYDLGPSGADGIYGDYTWNAVKQFKADQALGWEWMGDVGPGTMGRLDELFPSPEPTPSEVTPPAGWETPPKIQPPTVLTCPYLQDVPELGEVASSERVLQNGDSGEGVRQVQQVLLLLGYPLPLYGADARFGDETEAAVLAFQSDQDLNPSGVMDSESLEPLDEYCLTGGGGKGPHQATCSKKQHYKDFASNMVPVFNKIDPAVQPRGGVPGEVMFHTGGVQERQVWAVGANVNMSPMEQGDLINWQHGMIQSADNLVFEAEYDGGLKAKRESANSRDCESNNVTEPWIYNVPYGYGPQIIGLQANCGDHPRQPFPEAHLKNQNAKIRKISCRGAFNIWHVALNKQLDLTVQNVVFLGNTRVTLASHAEIQPSGNWVGSVDGNNGMSNAQCGRGAKTPVLKSPITIDDLGNLK